MSARAVAFSRGYFVRFVPVTTRWADNDAYGHINNVVYYSFFDTAVNSILIGAGTLDPATSAVIGLVVETRCTYFASLAFPEPVEVGVAVAHLGKSSVRYRLGVFKSGGATAAAQADYTHVYVDRATRKPVPLPRDVRALLDGLALESREPARRSGSDS